MCQRTIRSPGSGSLQLSPSHAARRAGVVGSGEGMTTALAPQRNPPPREIPHSSGRVIRYNGNVPEVLVILLVIPVITRTPKMNLILLLSVMILYENM